MTGMWSATTNTQLTWDFTQYGQDWHHDYYRAAVAPTPAPVSDAPSYAEQERIQRVRTRQQMDWMRVARNIDARNDVHVAFVGRDMRAIELAKDIMGIDAIRQLAESGYVDVPSHTDGIGYRLRPWRRIGCLTRSRDGAWAEIAMSLCIHPDDTYPPGDELAALWLELRFNEESLLRRANRHYTLADPGGEYRLETDRTPYPVLLARTLLAREEAA